MSMVLNARRGAADRGKKRVGRVQLQIRRALIAADGRPVQIGDLLPRCFPAARNYPRWMRKSDWNVFQAEVGNEIVPCCIRMIFGYAAKARRQHLLHVKTRKRQC
jgi:hypothetical protein